MKKIYEDLKHVFDSNASFRILCIVGVFIVALLIFSLGVIVGFHKASFGHAWEEHYDQNFGMGNRNPYPVNMGRVGMMDYFPNAHGAAGKIIKVELPNIIVQDDDNTEKAVLIQNDTNIEEGGVQAASTDLKIDDFVVVIGTPNDKGIIEAKFIRVIPSPEFLK